MTDPKEEKKEAKVVAKAVRSGKEELHSIDFLDILKADCPICLQPLKPPIWACAVALPEFHAHHQECAKKMALGTAFPTCSVCKSGGLGPSRFLDKQYEALFVNCPNKDCSFACALADIDTVLKQHQDQCDKRPLPCFHGLECVQESDLCSFTAANAEELFAHMINHHSDYVHTEWFGAFNGASNVTSIKQDEYVWLPFIIKSKDPTKRVIVLRFTERGKDGRYDRTLVAVTPSFTERIPVCYVLAVNGKKTEMEWQTTLNVQDLLSMKSHRDVEKHGLGFYFNEKDAPDHVREDGHWSIFTMVLADPDETWILREPEEITQRANALAERKAETMKREREEKKKKEDEEKLKKDEEEKKKEEKKKKKELIVKACKSKGKATGDRKKLKETIDELEKKEEEEKQKKKGERRTLKEVREEEEEKAKALHLPRRKQPDRKGKRKRGEEDNGAGSGSAMYDPSSDGNGKDKETETKPREEKKARVQIDLVGADEKEPEQKADSKYPEWFKKLLPLDIVECQPEDNGVWHYAMVTEVQPVEGNRVLVSLDTQGIDRTLGTWSMRDPTFGSREYMRPVQPCDHPVSLLTFTDSRRLARSVQKMIDEGRAPLAIDFRSNGVAEWHRASVTTVGYPRSEYPTLQIRCPEHGMSHGERGVIYLFPSSVAVMAPPGRYTRA